MAVTLHLIGVTERTRKLKKALVSKSATDDQYAQSIGVCPERARYWTESYKQSGGQPEVVRRAKALANVLENMTLFISPDELLVGYIASDKKFLPFYPEISSLIVNQHLEDGLIDKAFQDEIKTITDWWKGKTLADRVNYEFEKELTPEERQSIASHRSLSMDTHTLGAGTMTVDYEYVLKHGLKGLIAQTEQQLSTIAKIKDGPQYFENLEVKHFLEAMIIACKGVMRWASRYSQQAREMAAQESDATRRTELEEISRICAKVPAHPPQSFHEALQSFFFIHLVANQIERATHGLGQRFDQLFWPYYEDSVVNGVMTQNQAQELIECLWIKLTEIGLLLSRVRRLSFQATSLFQAFTLGGVKENGEDACNELTTVVLNATKSIRTNQPTLNLRYNPRIPEKYVIDALEVIKTGMGMPAFRNDDEVIQRFLSRGARLEQARDWAVSGCVVEAIPSMNVNTKREVYNMIAAKCFELALNNGRDMINGEVLGPATGDPQNFIIYDEVVEAFKEQYRYTAKLGAKTRAIVSYHEAQCMHRPFASALFRKTLEVKKDIMSWDEIPASTWVTITGMVDTIDSLAAIKKLVFEEQKVSLPELLDALSRNWEGKEELRQMLIGQAPKFGNDDDYVDEIARDVFDMSAQVFRDDTRTYFGQPHIGSFQATAWFTRWADLVSALPNGRRLGEPLSDGGISPLSGYDRKGPTAVLKSVSKIDPIPHMGVLLNQRFTPTILKGDKGRALFLSYIKTWYDLGIDHVQFNVVDTATLRAAQKEPEKYPDLIVRVAGYSASWNELNEITQEAIIARTEHCTI